MAASCKKIASLTSTQLCPHCPTNKLYSPQQWMSNAVGLGKSIAKQILLGDPINFACFVAARLNRSLAGTSLSNACVHMSETIIIYLSRHTIGIACTIWMNSNHVVRCCKKHAGTIGQNFNNFVWWHFWHTQTDHWQRHCFSMCLSSETSLFRQTAELYCTTKKAVVHIPKGKLTKLN